MSSSVAQKLYGTAKKYIKIEKQRIGSRLRLRDYKN